MLAWIRPKVISPEDISPETGVMSPEILSRVAWKNNYLKDETYGLWIVNKVQKSLPLKRLKDFDYIANDHMVKTGICLSNDSGGVVFSNIKVKRC